MNAHRRCASRWSTAAALAHGRPLLVAQRLQMREGARALEPAAAVDGDALALDVGGMVGDEKGGEIGQLLRAAGPAERIVDAVRADPRLWHQALARARRREGARRDGDEADA